MEKDSFREMLLQYGYEKIFDLIDMIARFGIKNEKEEKTLDNINESLDEYYSNKKGDMANTYKVFRSNFGANELLNNTISIYLLREEFINERFNLDVINEYNKVYDKINEYKQILINYENDILEGKTR